MSNKTKSKKNLVLDLAIGERVKARRLLMSMTQEELAKHLNITFQQVQKYEKGKNRISASTLYSIAQKLCVPLEYFFKNLETPNMALSDNDAEKYSVGSSSRKKREGMEIARYYASLQDMKVKKSLLSLVRVLAKAEKNGQ